jgi:predicted nucleic acid-binding protein
VILVDTGPIVQAGRYTLIESLSADLDRVAELVEKYDLLLGTVDAPVIALAERLNITTVVTLESVNGGVGHDCGPDGGGGSL